MISIHISDCTTNYGFGVFTGDREKVRVEMPKKKGVRWSFSKFVSLTVSWTDDGNGKTMSNLNFPKKKL